MNTRSSRKLALVTGFFLITLLALASSPVGAKTPTIISTTFTSEYVVGTFDEELQSIIGNENGWVVQMANPRIERRPSYDPGFCNFWPSDPSCAQYLIVDSFTFKFTGPDADLLNERVGQYLVQGWAGKTWTDLGLMEISEYSPGTCSFYFYVGSDEGQNQIYFATMGSASCQKDTDGTFILDDVVVNPASTCFFDFRSDNPGNLWGHTGSMSILHGVAEYAIFADENIIIRNDAFVVGDVGTNGENIQIIDNAVIDGNQDFGAGIELTPVELPSGGTPSDLVISDSKEVILTEEDSPYRFDRIFIDKLAKAIIQGHVTVYVKGKTEVRGSGQIAVMADPASSLTIYSGGDVEFRNYAVINQDSGKLTIYGTQDCAKVIVRNDAIVKGVVYAPNAFLDIRDRVIIYGSVAGKTAEVRGTTKIYWDGSVGSN